MNGGKIVGWESSSGPYSSGYEVKNVTSSGYDVYVYGVGSKKGSITEVLCPTWTLNNGQDDITWENATNLGNGNYKYRVNKSAHKNESGYYATHLYAKDSSGIQNMVGNFDVKVP